MHAYITASADSGRLRFGSPDSGDIILPAGGEWEVAHTWRWPPSGLGLGPITVQPPTAAELHLERLAYPGRDESALSEWGLDDWAEGLGDDKGLSGLVFGAGLAASTPRPEDHDGASMSRRAVLASAATLAGVGTAATGAASAAESELTVAELEVGQNGHGFDLRLPGRVANVLPSDQDYQLVSKGSTVGTLTTDDPVVTVPAGTTGTLRIATEADLGAVHQLQSWVRNNPTTFTASLDTNPAALSAGAERTITADSDHVDAVEEAGADATVVRIGGQSIAHADERATADRGHWTVTDGELVYVAGATPPRGTTVEVEAGVRRTTELQDDIGRSLP